MAELTDEQTVDALLAGGVDDWAWYEDSINRLTEEELRNPSTFLAALLAGGVEDWEWYGDSIRDYQARSGLTDEAGEAETPTVVPVEGSAPVVPEPESVRRLRAHLGDAYEAEAATFWKGKSHPKEFKAVLDVVKNRGTLEEARLLYLDKVIGKAS